MSLNTSHFDEAREDAAVDKASADAELENALWTINWIANFYADNYADEVRDPRVKEALERMQIVKANLDRATNDFISAVTVVRNEHIGNAESYWKLHTRKAA